MTLVDERNSQNLGYTLTENFFADLSMEEINAGYTGFEPEHLFLQDIPEW